MIYTKPQVEIVKFDNKSFIATSGGYISASDYVSSYGIEGWNGNSTFDCSSFGNCGKAVCAPGGGQFTQNGGGKWKYKP